MSALAANPSIRYEADMFRETGRSGRRPLGFLQIWWRFLHAVRLTKRTSGLTHTLTCCVALLVVNLVLIPATSVTVEGASVSMVDAATISILNDQDVSRYQRIFDLQEGGDWKAADKVIAKLEDRILMGHLLYQRYMHPTKYRSKFKELSTWMKKYADHPGAYRVYRLARKRKPVKAHAPKRPIRPNGRKAIEIPTVQSAKYVSPRKRSRSTRREVRRLQSHIRSHVRDQRPNGAVNHLKSGKYRNLLDPTEIAILYAGIVKGYFQLGHNKRAYALASQNADQARRYLPTIDLYGGLAAWQLGNNMAAVEHFSALAESGTASDRERVLGAFWAARAHLVARSPDRVGRYLRIAAAQPRTFYGQLALRLLGDGVPLDWEAPVLLPSDYARLKDSAYVQRAVALSQIGRLYWAERELRTAFVAGPNYTREAMLALAVRLGLPSAELRLSRAILASDGYAYDRALFPVPPWKPEGGFKIDRAILFALMRQESGFNSRAKSGAGARGLMQLMPRTASFMARDRSLHGRNKKKLFAPEYNVHLGQKYVIHLMNAHDFLDNLIMVIAAYNGGPGNLRKWQRRIKETHDPLMFIERLPSRENREFVRRVFTNIWIYRARLNQAAPTLDAMARGHWPIYQPLDLQIETAGAQETIDNVPQD
jgi:soluble lytic murein transglycosylase